MKTLSQRVKAFSAVLVLGIGAAGLFIFLAQNHQISLAQQADAARDREAMMSDLALTTKQIQVHVVQVQQFLTDVSATRSLDGLDDGPAQAEANAKAFEETVTRAEGLAKSLDLPKTQAALKETQGLFPDYYREGQVMADAYVREGTAAGNAHMGRFDAASAALYGGLNRVIDDVQRNGDQISEQADAAVIASTANARLLRNLSVAGVILMASLLIAYAVYILRALVTPLTQFAGQLDEIAADKLDVRVLHTGRTDEVGHVARAIDGFRKAEIEFRGRESVENAARQERRDRRERLEAAIAMFRDRVASVMQSIDSSTNQMDAVTRSLTEISDSTALQSRSAASSTHEATDNVQIVAAAAEELAASIADISDKIGLSQTVVRKTGQVTADSERNIARLAQASERIGDIVGLIQSISAQTNLLALNATIEAARAGDAGKGFAVVASEVKALASQTGKATEEIIRQIQEIQSETGTAVQSIKSIADHMSEVEQYTLAISEAVEQQSRATQDIAQNVAQAASCTAMAQNQVSEMEGAAIQTQTSAGEVGATTQSLARDKAALSQTIDTFLSEVAA
ncbi:methyl-accepting chemotaxis protein [Asticcacaulis sp. AC460]|uniref:methyl-accepting chemotaxis protein n=1 Tax=Asticcacaulis sp. AC460 TaxID=1282360 RepID=UPI0003C3BE53|nr:HAMP domain-containing methyl-accepting chemotaxis protein [Asticcacaulis sp. AC460]ESQ91098.1 methyl-accepting chemotaxis protein [Asticcacaulis sp. AC460]